jgi:hypothetical protein
VIRAKTLLSLALALSGTLVSAPGPAAQLASSRSFPFLGATGWRDAGLAPMRGVTVGPIENTRHRGRGYGTPASARTFFELRAMGADWVSLTPFGRLPDLKGTAIDFSFEAPFVENKKAVLAAIEQAHALGLRVLIVPHLWVESGEWRALVDPGDEAAWRAYAESYRRFSTAWAEVAEAGQADLFSVGVEQRSFVTTQRAPLYHDVIASVRKVFHGPLTYSGNWDDIDQSVILGELDVIGINAFFPLAEKDGASFETLLAGGKRVAEKGKQLAESWQKPVLFTEVGYTTRPDPAVKPWEWPDGMKDVHVDERAQADAYAALLAPVFDEPWFAGFFVWRMYADADDTSQEAEWGFSPRHKEAEIVLRDAFAARWASDPWPPPGGYVQRFGATAPLVWDGPTYPAWGPVHVAATSAAAPLVEIFALQDPALRAVGERRLGERLRHLGHLDRSVFVGRAEIELFAREAGQRTGDPQAELLAEAVFLAIAVEQRRPHDDVPQARRLHGGLELVLRPQIQARGAIRADARDEGVGAPGVGLRERFEQPLRIDEIDLAERFVGAGFLAGGAQAAEDRVDGRGLGLGEELGVGLAVFVVEDVFVDRDGLVQVGRERAFATDERGHPLRGVLGGARGEEPEHLASDEPGATCDDDRVECQCHGAHPAPKRGGEQRGGLTRMMSVI